MTPLKEELTANRPSLVVAYPKTGYTSALCRHYRLRGWEIHLAASGDEARQLAVQLSPEVVVLATDLPDESGWLICQKLLSERPDQKVVLVTNRTGPANQTFADFVGAVALVHEEAGIQALIEEIDGATLLSPTG
jgi:DNA-binding response OmpR family regulator